MFLSPIHFVNYVFLAILLEHGSVCSGIEVIQCNPGSSHWCQVYPDDETLASLPISKEGRYKFSCCYYDGKIFVFGGEWGQQLFKNIDCFDIGVYNRTHDLW